MRFREYRSNIAFGQLETREKEKESGELATNFSDQNRGAEVGIKESGIISIFHQTGKGPKRKGAETEKGPKRKGAKRERGRKERGIISF
jgi:hypothetical protein